MQVNDIITTQAKLNIELSGISSSINNELSGISTKVEKLLNDAFNAGRMETQQYMVDKRVVAAEIEYIINSPFLNTGGMMHELKKYINQLDPEFIEGVTDRREISLYS